MIETIYGPITEDQFEQYKQSVVGRIYAILPMKEEEMLTTTDYIENLNYELVGSVDVFTHCERVLSVVCLLNQVIGEVNHNKYRRQILRCCKIISGLGDANV